MDRVLHIVSKIFNNIFVRNTSIGNSLFSRILVSITNQPLLYLPVVFVIIGFSIGLVKRLIRS